MKNIYGRALRHLNNKNIDEKLELVEAIPTNNTTGIFMDVPGEFVEVPGEVPREADLGADGDGAEGYTGNDTSGLFLADGTILLQEPPGDTSYVLGPMISMWYSWANYTQIGYVRQSDRRMVNLGRITGELESWDGESGFTSYGQLTIEQASWYKNQSRSDYRAFYPGPPSNPADQYSRYLGSIVNTTKPTTFIRKDPDTTKSFDPNDNFAAQVARGEVEIPEIPRGTAQYDMASELVMIGLSFAAVKLIMGAIAAGGTFVKTEISKTLQLWKATGPSVTRTVTKTKTVNTPSKIKYPTKPRVRVEPQPSPNRPPSPSRGRGMGDRWEGPLSMSQQLKGKFIAEEIRDLPVELIHVINSIIAEIGSKPEAINKLIKLLKKKTPMKESREVLAEDRKRILRDLRKPVQVEEIGPPTKFKFKPKQRENKSVGVDMMKIPDTPKQYKPPMNIWGKGDYNANVRSSQEKKNEVLELVGASEHHWTYMTDERVKKQQEKVNEMAAAEYDKELQLIYEKYKKEEEKIKKLKTAVRKRA